ncbi:hypothetical protein J4456_02570 [Candidatus Pacearchaeota archaeon]|nr:hypothetical protein [Candidatus Pacearchaeota archaeon]
MTYEIYDQYGIIKSVDYKTEAEKIVIDYNKIGYRNRANYKKVGLITKILRICKLKKSLEREINERTERVQNLSLERTIYSLRTTQRPKHS